MIDLFAASIELEALLTSESTNLLKSDSKLDSGITLTILSFWASWAFMSYPVKISCMAFLVPTIRVRICVPPIPGIRPKLIYGRAKEALLFATIMSVRRAS